MPASYLELAYAFVHNLTIAHDWQEQDMVTEDNSDMSNNRHLNDLMLLHLQLNTLVLWNKYYSRPHYNMAEALKPKTPERSEGVSCID